MIALQDARSHLRIDGDQDDTEIGLKLSEATALVYAYIGQPSDFTPTGWQIQALDAAILLVTGELWRNREAGTADPLSSNARRILDLFKRPIYA